MMAGARCRRADGARRPRCCGIARGDRRTRDFTLNTLRARAGRRGGRLPGLSHLRRRQAASRARTAATSTGRSRARAAAQPRRRRQRVRLPARRAARRAPARRRAAPQGCRASRALPAVHRAGGGQGRRGHGVLPLPAARLAERRRRRPATLRHLGRAPSTPPARDRARHWPHTMLATSTHDNKRSEDVRARIDVLSEMPAAWRLTMRRWSRAEPAAQAPGRRRAGAVAQRRVPALPDAARQPARRRARTRRCAELCASASRRYMLKAAREAKVRTSWIQPRRRPTKRRWPPSCAALLAPRAATLPRPTCARRSPARLVRRAQQPRHGARSSARRPACPISTRATRRSNCRLVDPDNRRPVDYARRRALLSQAQELAAQPERGAALRELLEPGGRRRGQVLGRLARAAAAARTRGDARACRVPAARGARRARARTSSPSRGATARNG